MRLLRALAMVATLALAACAAPASQQGAQSAPTHRLRTGGPNPPQRLDAHCAVDADCTAKPQCVDEECRCVKNSCLVLREAIDPSIDPAPATSVR